MIGVGQTVRVYMVPPNRATPSWLTGKVTQIFKGTGRVQVAIEIGGITREHKLEPEQVFPHTQENSNAENSG